MTIIQLSGIKEEPINESQLIATSQLYEFI